jgi:hypothetical protein
LVYNLTANDITTANTSIIINSAHSNPNTSSSIMAASDVAPNNNTISVASRAAIKPHASANVWNLKKGQQSQSQSNSPPHLSSSQNSPSLKPYPSNTSTSSRPPKASEQHFNEPSHKTPRNDISNANLPSRLAPPSLDDRETWPEVGQASTVSSSHVSTPVNEHEPTQQQYSHASRKSTLIRCWPHSS